MLNLNL